jgi:hypothetical protein
MKHQGFNSIIPKNVSDVCLDLFKNLWIHHNIQLGQLLALKSGKAGVNFTPALLNYIHLILPALLKTFRLYRRSDPFC